MTSEQEHYQAIREAIIDGDEDLAPVVLQAALDDGLSPLALLNEGLMPGADEVGQLFESGTYFLPELMLTGRALQAAMNILTPALKAEQAAGGAPASETGVVVIATIQSDIHDLGKNMVSSMLTASGFHVHDLGVDVPIKSIIAKAKEEGAHIIACSALLTTSMPFMRDLLDMLVVMGERPRFKVMVGGAPVTPAWAAEIGADGTADSPIGAVQLARRLIQEQKEERAA